MIESLRDMSPKSCMVNLAVWPYQKGEVILQNYNVLLTMSSLITHSSAFVTVFNDQILTTCRELLKEKRPSYAMMNKVIAQQMSSYLFPCADNSSQKVSLWSMRASNPMTSIVDALCRYP